MNETNLQARFLHASLARAATPAGEKRRMAVRNCAATELDFCEFDWPGAEPFCARDDGNRFSTPTALTQGCEHSELSWVERRPQPYAEGIVSAFEDATPSE